MDRHLPLEGQLVSSEWLGRAGGERLRIRVSPPPPPLPGGAPGCPVAIPTPASAAPTPPRFLVGLSEVEGGHVHGAGVAPHVLGERTGVLAELVGLEVDVGAEDDELLLETLAVGAQVVVLAEVVLEGVVVPVVVRLARVLAVADEAPLVPFPTVLVQLVVVVETGAAEPAHGVALEAGLVGGAGQVVAHLHVLLELLVGEQLVLVGEDLLVPGAQVAHLLVVDGAHVAVQVGPPEPGEIAGVVGAVVAQQ